MLFAEVSVRAFEIRGEKEGLLCRDGIPMFEVEDRFGGTRKTTRYLFWFPGKRTGEYVFPCIPAGKGQTNYELMWNAWLDIVRSGLTSIDFGNADLSFWGREDDYGVSTRLERINCSTSIDGILFSKSGETLEYCPSGRRGHYSVPARTTRIATDAFRFCRQLTSVEIPEGVETISTHAFEGCWNLVSVKFPGTLRRIEDEVFKNCFRLQAVAIPAKCHVGSRCFENCIRLGNVSLGPECFVDSFAFEGCKTLQSISAGTNCEGMFPESFLPETIRVKLRNSSGVKDRFGVKYVFV